jgi:hypothetical protein
MSNLIMYLNYVRNTNSLPPPAMRHNQKEVPREIQVGWVNVGKKTEAYTTALYRAFQENLDVLYVQEPATYRWTKT